MRLSFVGAMVIVGVFFQNCSGPSMTPSVSFARLSVVAENGETLVCRTEGEMASQAPYGYLCLYSEANFAGQACCLARAAAARLLSIPDSTAAAVGAGSVKVSSAFQYTVCSNKISTLAEFETLINNQAAQSGSGLTCASGDQSLTQYMMGNSVFYGIRTVVF